MASGSNKPHRHLGAAHTRAALREAVAEHLNFDSNGPGRPNFEPTALVPEGCTVAGISLW